MLWYRSAISLFKESTCSAALAATSTLVNNCVEPVADSLNFCSQDLRALFSSSPPSSIILVTSSIEVPKAATADLIFSSLAIDLKATSILFLSSDKSISASADALFIPSCSLDIAIDKSNTAPAIEALNWFSILDFIAWRSKTKEASCVLSCLSKLALDSSVVIFILLNSCWNCNSIICLFCSLLINVSLSCQAAFLFISLIWFW